MKRILGILMLLTVVVLQGCGNDDIENEQDYESEVEQYEENEEADNLRGEREFDISSGEHGYLGVRWIEHMNDNLPNRLAFSDRELETAEWLVEELLDMGFDADQVEVQTFNFDSSTSSWWGDASWTVEWFEEIGYYEGLERIDYSQNVILTIPGRSEETIIIGAHYDGVGNPGISDNAGGTVLLLENAYHMQNVDHYYTLQYVFFGAEEVGLIGAFYLADNMTQEEIDNLIMVINADVIMDGPNLVYSIGYIEELPDIPNEILWETPEISQNALSEHVKEIADQLNDLQSTDLISKPLGITLSSDQLAFVQFSVPIMVFYATHPVQYPELFDGDVLHSENDCLDFIIENHPGRVEQALHEFGLFLEAVLSNEFAQ